MNRNSGNAWAGAAGVLILVAVLARVLTLPVSPALLGAEAGLALVAAVILGVSLRLGRSQTAPGLAVTLLSALAPALLAALALRLVAVYLPAYPMVAALVFAALLLAADLAGSRPITLAGGLAVLAVFSELWLTTQPINGTSAATLGVALAVLFGILILGGEQGRRARRVVDADALRGSIYAVLSRRLGSARDVPAVASAVLEACRELYPLTTYGSVYLLDETDGLVKPAAVQLGPDGLGAGGPQLELRRGEGLGGLTFVSGDPLLWPTAVDVSMVEATMQEPNRARLRIARPGFARCAVGTRLVDPSGQAIGAIVLTSHRRENVWTAGDLPALEALAAETAQAVERAREHAADVDRALLDSITGLVTHRQLVTVIDKEVSRAARAQESVALIFSDLDSFKQINDAWGHDTGNRILRMFADVLRSTLRREDTAARYGGDEFVCVLPGADRAQAAAIAERIRQRFTAAARTDPIGPSTTSVSSGVAVFPADAQNAEALLAAADAELLRAKQRRVIDREITGRPAPGGVSPSVPQQ
ncbi:MAG: GGDEF domain-containing protein [Candidatus Dormibacteraeota bacterium]|nr:GGDEF domain-containing protein [Candidatus Dormibacteraeota bacterium]